MDKAISFTQLSQAQDTPVTTLDTTLFLVRYAYARSAESQGFNDTGQDFLALIQNGRRFTFAICDGVGQSFFGDLSAKMIGRALVDWLWQAHLWDESWGVEQKLPGFLESLALEVSRAVQRLELPGDLPNLLIDVLEEKRRKGSESMFAAGCLDWDEEQLFLTWMGDIRLWLLDPQGNVLFKNHLERQARWSSLAGLVGKVHQYTSPLRAGPRLVCYTDGLAVLDSHPDAWRSDYALDDAILATGIMPASDDLCYLEVIAKGREFPQVNSAGVGL